MNRCYQILYKSHKKIFIKKFVSSPTFSFLPSYFLKNSVLVFLYLLILEWEEVCQGPSFPSLPIWLLLSSILSTNSVLHSFTLTVLCINGSCSKEISWVSSPCVCLHSCDRGQLSFKSFTLSLGCVSITWLDPQGLPPGPVARCQSPAALPALCLI